MPAADVDTVVVTCSAQTQAYTVGGTVNGLTQAGLVLVNNGNGELFNVSPPGGQFTLSKTVVSGANYDVQVRTQPTGQNCMVQNGSGTMGAGNVTNVLVTCTLNSYNLKGTVTGLNLGGLLGNPLILANGTDAITVPFGSSSFQFDKQVAYGSSYSVVVQQQPTVVGLPLLACTVSNGSGFMGAGDVTNVYVSCQ
jgi:hypothetical protein